jgi:hypothetical protein
LSKVQPKTLQPKITGGTKMPERPNSIFCMGFLLSLRQLAGFGAGGKGGTLLLAITPSDGT